MASQMHINKMRKLILSYKNKFYNKEKVFEVVKHYDSTPMQHTEIFTAVNITETSPYKSYPRFPPNI